MEALGGTIKLVECWYGVGIELKFPFVKKRGFPCRIDAFFVISQHEKGIVAIRNAMAEAGCFGSKPCGDQ